MYPYKYGEVESQRERRVKQQKLYLSCHILNLKNPKVEYKKISVSRKILVSFVKPHTG